MINLLIISSMISLYFNSALATSCGEAITSCRSQGSGMFVTFINKRPEVITEKISSVGTSDMEIHETNFEEKIKCSYDFKNLSSVNPLKIMKLYSNICVELKDKFNYVFNGGTRCRALPKREAQYGGTVKVVDTKRSPLGYIWQVGECSLSSDKYFEKIKIKSSVKKLVDNKFLLVSEDDNSLTYYANPGYVVKLEKNEKLCKKDKNCELNILQKTRLSSAILDADGKLHTDEPL